MKHNSYYCLLILKLPFWCSISQLWNILFWVQLRFLIFILCRLSYCAGLFFFLPPKLLVSPLQLKVYVHIFIAS